MAQAAGVSALQPEGLDHMRRAVDETVAERDRMIATLRGAGWPVPDSQANFVWLPGPDALDVAGRLERQGLTVRPFPEEGIRITVGPAEANDRVLDVLT